MSILCARAHTHTHIGVDLDFFFFLLLQSKIRKGFLNMELSATHLVIMKYAALQRMFTLPNGCSIIKLYFIFASQLYAPH